LPENSPSISDRGPLIQAQALLKEYDGGRVQALRGLDLQIDQGELLAITGPSGCGKSTLLQMIGALDLPTSGELLFDGTPIAARKNLARFRSREIGFIFQSFHLIPTLTASENVQVPMLEMPFTRSERRARAQALLESVGLAERMRHHPAQLSGGERQRVAVARSLANGPRLLLADEPTGNLDSKNADRILQVLFDVRSLHGTTLVIVTHDPSIATKVDRVVQMLDGRVVDQMQSKQSGEAA
jgi:ABC-type lipoprotein export system ATPase subunit